MPTFVIGGLLALMVFLSAFGVWAKQTCTCGCFLGLSSCLSVLTMLLELTFAILTHRQGPGPAGGLQESQ